MNTRRRLPPNLSRPAVICCGALTALFGAPAEASNSPVIEMGEPAGFANLIGERTLVVDLYYGGSRRGEALVRVTPGSIRFVEPQNVLSLLPQLKNYDLVLEAISEQELPSHQGLRCSLGSDPHRCGRTTPALLSIIYDPEKFRVDIFLNPEFVSVQSRVEEQYLEAMEGGPSLINSFGVVISGQLGERKQHATVFDQLILAQGEKRLRADVSYSSVQGFEADRLLVELDRPGLRYSAGALWSPGLDLSGPRKFLGGGLESQIDTRLDKDYLTGSPVVVYLEQRARVDVLRDGRLLSSAIYEAGNQRIDTSNLPDGSYSIILHIEEPGRTPRDERRFFTKSRQIPSLGRTDIFLFGGLLIDDESGRAGEKIMGGAYLQGGLAIRMNQNWAFGGSVALADRTASSELSATYLTSLARVRAAATADTDGALGAMVQIASAGTSRFNFNFDLRRVVQDASRLLVNADESRAAINETTHTLPLRPRGSYSQLGGLVSYDLANLRVLGTSYYREEAGQDPQYSVGPAVEWDVLRRGSLTLTVRGDMTFTERGNAGFAGFSLRMLGPRSTYAARAGARIGSIDDGDSGEGAIAALSGAWARSVAGGELSLGAGLEHQRMRENVTVSGDFRRPGGSLSLDVAHTDGKIDTTQYGLGFKTILAAGAGELQIGGRNVHESLLVTRVEGADEDDTFEVLINEQPSGSITGTKSLTLAMPAYRSYSVRIRPTGERLLDYDSASRAVALYPGTVAKVEWKTSPVTIKMGRLVTADGLSVSGATLTAPGTWAETDEGGNFQIEVADDVELLVRLPDGTSFATVLPRSRSASSVTRVGTIVAAMRDPQLSHAISARLVNGE